MHTFNLGGADSVVMESAIRSVYARHGRDIHAASMARREALEETFRQVQRKDAAANAVGTLNARAVEYVYTKVLETKFEALSASVLIATDKSVPPGAKKHIVERTQESGRAGFISGRDSEYNTAEIAQVEQAFGVAHIGIGIEWDVFELATAGFANLPLLERKLKAGRKAVEQFFNKLVWYGNKDRGLYGILTYPWVDKVTSAVSFVDATAADTMLAELHRIVNYASNESNGVFSSTDLGLSPRVYALLHSKVRGSTNDTTILEMFLKSSPFINDKSKVHQVPEFRGAGPGGTDVIMAFRAMDEETAAAVVPQGLTVAPVQERGLMSSQIMYMSTGGAVMRDSGNVLIAYVIAEA